MPRVFAALSLLALMATSACVTPDLGARPVPKTVALGDQTAFDGPVTDWPAIDWWTAYGDPQLDALIAEGLRGSPTIAAAEARLRKAGAVLGSADAAQSPSLTANGAVALSKPSYNTGLPTPSALQGYNDTGRVTLDFSYELDLWGKTRAAVAAATSEEAASAADVAQARLIVSTSIAAAYADLARLVADREVALSTLKVREETLTLVRRRVEGGYDSQAELHQAEVGPPAVRAELGAIDEQIAITRFRLAALMGQSPDRALSIAPPTVSAPKSLGMPASIPARLVGRRPDLSAARWRAEATASRIDQAQAMFYPNVNLVGLLGVSSLGIGNLLDAGSDVGSVGPAINLPIFDGGRRKANLRANRADFDAAVAAYDATLNLALEEVADAATSQRALDQRLVDSCQALDAATQGWILSRRRYTAGATDYASVLLAEDRMLAARRIVAGLESRRFILDLALIKALGGGWSDTQATL